MKRYSYSERDYAFGHAMLTLRTSMGLTQTGLADLLGVCWRAVAEWEAGSSYPKAEHLKQLMAQGCSSRPYHWDSRINRGAEGHVARVGGH